MNEEEKQALKILKGLEFYEWYVKTDNFEGHANEVVEKVEKAIKIIINLIDKQQKQIEFYSLQELGYLQGYEDGKSHKQTAVAIKNENAQYELIKRVIEEKDKEIEKLKSKKYILNAETNEIKEIPISDDYISKDKIKDKLEKYNDAYMTININNRSAGKTFKQAVNYEVRKVLNELLQSGQESDQEGGQEDE